jgi:hypothetical protein
MYDTYNLAWVLAAIAVSSNSNLVADFTPANLTVTGSARAVNVKFLLCYVR